MLLYFSHFHLIFQLFKGSGYALASLFFFFYLVCKCRCIVSSHIGQFMHVCCLNFINKASVSVQLSVNYTVALYLLIAANKD